MKKYDFVSIGDITTDAFIRLKDASVHCDINKENCQLCVDFGAKIPYESVTEVLAVGNSTNAAVSAHRLGLNSAPYTNIGNDEGGKKCLEKLQAEGISTELIEAHDGKHTNYHYVLWYEDERTILIKHEEFEYKIPDMGDEGWLYLSSTGENSVPYHHELATWLKENPKIKLAFQPGTFQIKLGKDELADIYAVSEVFFCNVQEAQKILVTDEGDIKKLMEGIHALGPKITVVTDGPKGAYALDAEGQAWFMPPYPDPKPPLDRTGAGDSFSSAFVSALALGKNVDEAITWAPINSMSVVQYVGAQEGLLTQEQIKDYISKAPEDYKAKQI